MTQPAPLILVVEDEPDLRELIGDIVQDAGYRIEVAGNYSEGSLLLNASQPALLITNVPLAGGGDGHNLAVLARRLGVPTLIISGRPEVIIADVGRGLS